MLGAPLVPAVVLAAPPPAGPLGPASLPHAATIKTNPKAQCAQYATAEPRAPGVFAVFKSIEFPFDARRVQSVMLLAARFQSLLCLGGRETRPAYMRPPKREPPGTPSGTDCCRGQVDDEARPVT